MSNSVVERYASAIRSSNLSVEGRTTRSDSDVLGGMGLAAQALESGRGVNGQAITPEPSAVPLQRLLQGDNRAAKEIVAVLAEDAWKQARTMNVRLDRARARAMAQACLAWFRHGTCKACGGHGRRLIPGTRTLGTADCKECRGTGKVEFERQFRVAERELARWLAAKIERAAAIAGPEAMRHLAGYLDLKRAVEDAGK